VSTPTHLSKEFNRNLVTSLVEHEQIKTTLPKARDTARLAEKVVILVHPVVLLNFNRSSLWARKATGRRIRVLPHFF
jgi:ribosomal protein L17